MNDRSIKNSPSAEKRKFVSTREFITTEEAANYLGLQPTTLEAWRCRGGGPKHFRFGRSVRYRIGDLEAWSETRSSWNTLEGGGA